MIYFFTEDTEFDSSILVFAPAWITSIVQQAEFEIDNINIIFCSDQYLLKINQDYLQHDYFTDIITFNNSENTLIIDADIFISLVRVKDNSEREQTTFFKELLRVIIHGVLHLIGYDDKDLLSQTNMRKLEDNSLDLYFRKFHKPE